MKCLAAAALVAAMFTPAFAGEAEDHAVLFLAADLVCLGQEIPEELVGTTILMAAEELEMPQKQATLYLATQAAAFESNFGSLPNDTRRSFCSNVKVMVDQWSDLKAGR